MGKGHLWLACNTAVVSGTIIGNSAHNEGIGSGRLQNHAVASQGTPCAIEHREVPSSLNPTAMEQSEPLQQSGQPGQATELCCACACSYEHLKCSRVSRFSREQ